MSRHARLIVGDWVIPAYDYTATAKVVRDRVEVTLSLPRGEVAKALVSALVGPDCSQCRKPADVDEEGRPCCLADFPGREYLPLCLSCAGYSTTEAKLVTGGRLRP